MPEPSPLTLPRIKEWAAQCAAIPFQSTKLGHVYNPLDYAWPAHVQYLERFGFQHPTRRILMLGINPGPWGMTQSAVPFGDVHLVKHWMGIDAPIGQPEQMHPKRPVKGLDLTRREGSGKRLWGWAEAHFPDPQRFFEHVFVWSYCPLLFLERDSARNLTPDKLIKTDRAPLYDLCDQMLNAWIEHLQPDIVIGVGAFATQCFQRVLGETSPRTIGQILHPSPANPRANKDWAGTMEAQCNAFGLDWQALYQAQ